MQRKEAPAFRRGEHVTWDDVIEMTAQRCWGDDWRDLPEPARAGIQAAIDEHVRAFFIVLDMDPDVVIEMSPRHQNNT